MTPPASCARITKPLLHQDDMSKPPHVHRLPAPPALLTLTAFAALAAFGTAPAFADTVTLKSGQSYEGTVIRETEEAIVMTIAVTESITDEVTIRKDDIRGAVVKTPEDILEFEKLKAVDVRANSMTLVAYETAISACDSFQTRFPDSAHRQQVANQIKSLKEEKARVSKSEIKVDRRWYTPNEAQKERYQIDARLLLQQVEEKGAAGDFVGALNAFDMLEKDYPDSAAYPKAVPLALAVIPRLKAEIARVTPGAKEQAEKFKSAVQYQPEPDRSRMIAADRENQARAARIFKASSGKWKPFFPLINESVSSLTSTISSEMTRLSTIDTAPMDRSVALTENARELLEARNPDEALAKLNEALRAWNKNEAVPRLIKTAQTLKAVLIAEQVEREKAEEEKARQKELEALDAQG